MFIHAVSGRERGHDLMRARHWFGVQHDDLRVHVPEVNRRRRAVWVHGPQSVKLDLAAIHVFPAHVKQAAVREHPRRVVLLGVGGNEFNITAVAIAPIHHPDLSHPAIDPPLAARGNEGDVAVGQVGGFVIIERTRGQLSQARAVHVDFVKVIEIRARLAVGEQDSLCIVMHLGIADRAALRIEQNGELARAEVPVEELAHAGLAIAGIGLVMFVLTIIPDVGVPVRIIIARSGAEDDVRDRRHRAGQRLGQQWRRAMWHWLSRARCLNGRGQQAPDGEPRELGVEAILKAHKFHALAVLALVLREIFKQRPTGGTELGKTWTEAGRCSSLRIRLVQLWSFRRRDAMARATFFGRRLRICQRAKVGSNRARMTEARYSRNFCRKVRECRHVFGSMRRQCWRSAAKISRASAAKPESAMRTNSS